MSSKSNATTSDKAGPPVLEKNKWHLDFLLEKLRLQQQNKSFDALQKQVRMSLLEKRFAMDAIEKANLQKTLDNLQNYIQVKKVNRSWLVERLDCLSRQLGLKFNIDNQNSLFISSDMFYIEIALNADDTVKEVTVHHENSPNFYPCKELVNAISKGDFADLTLQLEGLISIYQINAEKSIKCKVFDALQALEMDLAYLSLLQASITKDAYQTCMHSPLGLLQKRRGGHPMQITYFVSPYDLIDIEKKQLHSQLTNDLINEKKIGCSVTVNLEASAATRLQITQLLSLNQDQQGRSAPVYAQMNSTNSMLLPATFVLKLSKPTPICITIFDLLEKVTDQKINCNRVPVPLMALIAHTASDGKAGPLEKGLFVSLPDQCHCYYLSDSDNLKGYLVNSIPFSDPQQVPKIINLLRQQALFNTIISSCVRIESKPDLETVQIFEVTALSHQYITIVLEYPYSQQLTTVEFDLNDISSITCTIYCGSQLTNTAKVGKVMQTCLSIPVTLRYLIKVWQQEYARVNLKKFESDNYNMGSNDPGGDDDFDPLAPTSNDARNSGVGSNNSGGGNGTSGSTSGSSSDKPIKKESFLDEYEFSPMEESAGAVDMNFDEVNNSCDSFTMSSLGGDSNQATEHAETENKDEPPSKRFKADTNALSITPISVSPPSHSTTATGSNDRRSSIEIIPISSANAKDLPASITITPINSSSSKSEKNRSSSSKSKSSDKEKIDRKKKRKREEMGPPQDPLNKPVSVSLHVANASSSSPIPSRGSGTTSPASIVPAASMAMKQSPKHSPVHHQASPKHSSISSPKHPTSSSGGKPSMSALKSAASSPKASPSHSMSYSLSSSLSSQNVISSPTLTMSSSSPSSSSDNGSGADKSSPLLQVKNRKGSLTAVIDKLKSAQTPDDDVFAFAPSPQSTITTTSSTTTTNNLPTTNAPNSSNTSNSSSANKSSEYMVKHSSDGMKITINKTKSKEKLSGGSSLTKSASFSSGSSSPKTHTGLKPGVNSGPASKKPSTSSSSLGPKTSSNKLPFQKSVSSSSLSSAKSYSPTKMSSSGGSMSSNMKNTSSGIYKDKSTKASSKTVSSTDKFRDTSDIMKMLGFASGAHTAESFMKSSKFQIPKISARVGSLPGEKESSIGSSSTGNIVSGKATSSSAPSTPSTSSGGGSGGLDATAKLLPEFSKYQYTYSAASKLPGDISPMHVPSAIKSMTIASSPKYNTQADTREAMSLETYHTGRFSHSSPALSFPSPLHPSSDNSSDKSMDNITADYTMSDAIKTAIPVKRSTTPSHNIHATVVKSPAPSPMILIPSPRSNEHNIPDDEGLMEELVGITK